MSAIAILDRIADLSDFNGVPSGNDIMAWDPGNSVWTPQDLGQVSVLGGDTLIDRLGSLLPLSGGTMSGPLDMGNNQITSVDDIIINSNSLNGTLQLIVDPTTLMLLDGSQAMQANMNLGSNELESVSVAYIGSLVVDGGDLLLNSTGISAPVGGKEITGFQTIAGTQLQAGYEVLTQRIHDASSYLDIISDGGRVMMPFMQVHFDDSGTDSGDFIQTIVGSYLAINSGLKIRLNAPNEIELASDLVTVTGPLNVGGLLTPDSVQTGGNISAASIDFNSMIAYGDFDMNGHALSNVGAFSVATFDVQQLRADVLDLAYSYASGSILNAYQISGQNGGTLYVGGNTESAVILNAPVETPYGINLQGTSAYNAAEFSVSNGAMTVQLIANGANGRIGLEDSIGGRAYASFDPQTDIIHYADGDWVKNVGTGESTINMGQGELNNAINVASSNISVDFLDSNGASEITAGIHLNMASYDIMNANSLSAGVVVINTVEFGTGGAQLVNDFSLGVTFYGSQFDLQGSPLRHSGDVLFNDQSVGPVLTSPDSTQWRLSVDNAGTISTTAI